MKSQKLEKILYTKNLLPMSISSLLQIIQLDYHIYDVDDSSIINSIVVSDNVPIVKGCLYIPYDENDKCIIEAVKFGAAAALTDHYIDGIPCIVVDSLNDAITNICIHFNKAISLPAISILGSEGKTTTKRMVSNVLNSEKKVFCYLGNWNTLQSLCCSLQRIENGTEVIVQEVDEKRINNTKNCSMILHPQIALITNIAEAHMGFYGSKEALINSFKGITAGMDENAPIVINADDPDSLSADFSREIITVGIYNKASNYLAINIIEHGHSTEFDILHSGDITHIKLSVIGEHNIYNAMMAFVVGRLQGISNSNIQKALYKYRNTDIRQNIVTLGGVTIYADCYNASVRSITYAIKCFSNLLQKSGKKIAVIGDIAEIEGYEDIYYKQIADLINNSSIDILVTCGKDSGIINRHIIDNIENMHAADKEELLKILIKLRARGKNSYLFKASRFMKLEESIKSAFPIHYYYMQLQKKIIYKINY